MKDYTIGAFWIACAAAGIAYFFTRNLFGLTAYLINYLAGLIAFFVYMAMRKDGSPWTGEEILAAFLATGVAQWLPFFLCFLFGFPP